MKINDKLNEVFDLEPGDPLLPLAPDPQIQKEDDFELARSTLRGLIGKNDTVISDLVELARNSEHPRAYEVVGQLVKAQSEIAKGLIDLHKQKKEIEGESSQSIKTQNNIVFTGSTSDLLKMISQQRAKTIDAS